ncbi:MAG: hypothetical protein ABFD07_02065 [Methanobacterium sp.]
MNTEKNQFIGAGEYTIREGKAPDQLPILKPVIVDISGTIKSVAEFLSKRLDQSDQINQKRCHVIIDREDISILLVIAENDPYLKGKVLAKLEMHPKFGEFGINTGKVWTPTELGMFFKMNRAFFKERDENMKLVTELMNFTATVNNSIERSAKENGDRTDKFAQTVNSNLPKSFSLEIPIFKGMQKETLEVETFAKINGRDVAFTLLSPGANQTTEDIRDKVIDEQIEKIKALCPDIAIIEQ